MKLNFPVTPKEVGVILKELAMQPKPPTTFLWGMPGIGKTEIITQIAQELNLPLRVWILSLMDPTEMKGLLVYDPTVKKADFVPLNMIPDDKAILFLDELPTAPPSVLNTALRMVNEKWIGNKKINDQTFIVCAGNRMADKVTPFKLSSAFVNRCIHLSLEPSLDNWSEWAINHNVKPEVIAYFHLFPNDFVQEPCTDKPFPTPRSWVTVSKLLDSKATTGMDALIAGSVGDEIAVRFQKFRENAFGIEGLIDDILAGKQSTTYPTSKQAERSYIIATALAQKVNTKKEMRGAFNYMFDAPPHWGPFKVVLFRGLQARNVDCIKLLEPEDWKRLAEWAKEVHLVS